MLFISGAIRAETIKKKVYATKSAQAFYKALNVRNSIRNFQIIVLSVLQAFEMHIRIDCNNKGW